MEGHQAGESVPVQCAGRLAISEAGGREGEDGSIVSKQRPVELWLGEQIVLVLGEVGVISGESSEVEAILGDGDDEQRVRIGAVSYEGEWLGQDKGGNFSA